MWSQGCECGCEVMGGCEVGCVCVGGSVRVCVGEVEL